MSLTAPTYLSPSSMTTFEQCPLRFKYSRIDGIREPPTEATLLGNFVHDVLQDLYLDSPENRSIARARDLARNLWDTKYRDDVAKLVRADKLNDFRWKAWFCIENLWKLEKPEDLTFSGIECELQTDFDGVKVRGFVDRYHLEDGNAIVVGDYKTGKVPSQMFLDDKFFQLMTYGAMFESLGMGTTKSVELIFLKGPRVFSKEIKRSDIEQTISRIKTVHDGIQERCEAEHFEPVKTRLCDWCYFKPKCPAWSNK